MLVSELSLWLCRCPKLPAKLQEYILSDRNTHCTAAAGLQVQKQAAAASRQEGESILFHSRPCSSSSVKKLTIKLRGTAAATQPAHSSQLQLRHSDSPKHRSLSNHAQPVKQASLGHAFKHTKLPSEAKCFKAAPVERPVTRRFKLQQRSKLKVHIKLSSPAQADQLSQRRSTVTHQQKRYGQGLQAGNDVKQEPIPTPEDAHLVRSAAVGMSALPAVAVSLAAQPQPGAEADETTAAAAAAAAATATATTAAKQAVLTAPESAVVVPESDATATCEPPVMDTALMFQKVATAVTKARQAFCLPVQLPTKHCACLYSCPPRGHQDP